MIFKDNRDSDIPSQGGVFFKIRGNTIKEAHPKVRVIETFQGVILPVMTDEFKRLNENILGL